MELTEHRCKRCGGALKPIGNGRWSCPYCACTYDEDTAAKNTQSLHDAFDEAKREIVCNLRRNLYDAVNDEYISSTKVKECCVELKKYIPDDFAANFYEIAVGNSVKQLTKYIRKINVEKNYDEIDSVVRFLIKSLQTEYLLELNNLVERAYKMRDLSLFEKYSTEISREAEKVENGVYETKMPREVFVAYSSKDMEKVSELVEVLEEQGLRCFVAARNLRHGKDSVEDYDNLLCDAMDHCKSFVFVSSTNSRNFDCDALKRELPYVQKKDIENAPAEYKNNYGTMPHSFKKPRVEYRIEESHGFNAPDSISNEFFDGYERVYSPEAVAERVAKQLIATPEKKSPEKKVTPPVTPVVAQSAPADSGSSKVEPLLKRALIYLEDGEWQNAEKYCEKALDIDPENAQAYVIKLMIDMDVRTQDELAKCAEPFEDNGNFKKAVRFADESLAATLNGYIETIKERIEAERKDGIYNAALRLMSLKTVEGYQDAISKFGEIPSWKDSRERIEKCKNGIKDINDKIEARRKDNIYEIACGLMLKKEIASYESAIDKFKTIPGWRDSKEKISQCEKSILEIEEKNERERKDDIYSDAVNYLKQSGSTATLISNTYKAKSYFQMIPGWKDADKKVEECDRRIEELKKQAEIERIEAEKRRKKTIKVSAICASIVAFVLVVAVLLNSVVIPAIETNKSYKDAVALMDQGKYEEAIDAFEVLDGYKDSKEQIGKCRTAINDKAYDFALKLMTDGKYEDAIKAFEALDGYKDSTAQIEKCNTAIKQRKYDDAVSLMSSGKYAEAMLAFKDLANFKDSADKIAECDTKIKDIDYDSAITLMEEGKYAEAIVAFEALGDYKDSTTKIEECNTAIKDISYDEALALMTEGKYTEAIVAFEAMNGYKDSTAKIEECNTAIKEAENNDAYNVAIALMNEGKYAEAIVAFEALGDYKDSTTKIEECKTAINNADYLNAVSLMNEGKYEEAITEFEKLGEFSDSAELLKKCRHYASYVFEINDSNTGYTLTGYSGSDLDLDIPEKYMGLPVTSIGSEAFRGCSSLTSVTIPHSVTSIGVDAFYNFSGLMSINVDEKNAYYKSTDGNLYSKDGKTLIQYAIGKAETSFAIPNDVTSIGVHAFYNCTTLTSVTIPDSVTSIGDSAFKGCSSLESITLPFVGTSKDGTGKKYFGAIFGASAYKYNGGSVPKSLKKVIITDCKIIDSYAFYGCTNLVTVSIPKSLTRLNYRTFDRCDNLESVIFIGSEEEWQSVSKYNDWNYCTNSSGYDGRYLPVIFAPECDGVNHYVETDAAVEPTCTETGLTEGSRCYVCEAVIVAQETIDALGHDEVQHEAKEPTCAEDGWDVYVTCSRCDYSTYVEKPINASNHNLVGHEAKEPTCAEIGWDAYVTCLRCDHTSYMEKEALGHSLTDGHCIKCNEEFYKREGNYVYIGEYPQSLKATNVTITDTIDDRGYYLGSDGEYYAMVTADPHETDYYFSTYTKVKSGTIYYFKVEPIKWRILFEEDGKALVFCDSIIANMSFENSDGFGDNNYANSKIRTWLNGNFYHAAFNELHKSIIVKTTVDNSAASTGGSSLSYANTYDNIFLLSYAEATNSSYGFAENIDTHDANRKLDASDYAIATGLVIENNNGYWWLRSHYDHISKAMVVNPGGYTTSEYDYVSFDVIGVAPALWLNINP